MKGGFDLLDAKDHQSDGCKRFLAKICLQALQKCKRQMFYLATNKQIINWIIFANKQVKVFRAIEALCFVSSCLFLRLDYVSARNEQSHGLHQNMLLRFEVRQTSV